jgi:hypothetical protein
VFDTETRTDQAQRLTSGNYRFIVDGQLAGDKTARNWQTRARANNSDVIMFSNFR